MRAQQYISECKFNFGRLIKIEFCDHTVLTMDFCPNLEYNVMEYADTEVWMNKNSVGGRYFSYTHACVLAIGSPVIASLLDDARRKCHTHKCGGVTRNYIKLDEFSDEATEICLKFFYGAKFSVGTLPAHTYRQCINFAIKMKAAELLAYLLANVFDEPRVALWMIHAVDNGTMCVELYPTFTYAIAQDICVYGFGSAIKPFLTQNIDQMRQILQCVEYKIIVFIAIVCARIINTYTPEYGLTVFVQEMRNVDTFTLTSNEQACARELPVIRDIMRKLTPPGEITGQLEQKIYDWSIMH